LGAQRLYTVPYVPILIGEEQKHLLEEGDLLFQDLDCGPLCDAIESVTQGFGGANFSHVGIVMQTERDSVMVVEAIGGSVKLSRLKDFLKRSRDAEGRPKVMVGRLRDPQIIQKALVSLKSYLGKPYDDYFDIGNESYYCTELVYFTFENNSEPLFRLFPMTFKSPKHDSFDPAWLEYYERLDAPIPEGEPGLNPGSVSRSPWLDMIYRFGDPDGFSAP